MAEGSDMGPWHALQSLTPSDCIVFEVPEDLPSGQLPSKLKCHIYRCGKCSMLHMHDVTKVHRTCLKFWIMCGVQEQLHFCPYKVKL